MSQQLKDNEKQQNEIMVHLKDSGYNSEKHLVGICKDWRALVENWANMNAVENRAEQYMEQIDPMFGRVQQLELMILDRETVKEQ